MGNDVICPKCNEFIGNIGELEACPCCGYEFSKEETPEEKDSLL